MPRVKSYWFDVELPSGRTVQVESRYPKEAGVVWCKCAPEWGVSSDVMAPPEKLPTSQSPTRLLVPAVRSDC